jgi:hypothetical protein
MDKILCEKHTMIKGAMHIHSTYSDGEFTLTELRQIFLAESCAFICMTDHAEYFNEDSLRLYRQECAALSDDKLRIVAGLEYDCERHMHILGYGASRLATTIAPQDVIRHIETQGAVSVIAHPKDEFFSWIESFDVLPQGIETWNSKYDGRYAPRPGTFALLQRLKLRKPGMHGFYGQDLHWKKQFRRLFVEVDSDSANPQAILAAVAAGKYSGRKDDLQLPSSGVLPEKLQVEFRRVHERSYRMWRFLKSGKNTLDRAGVRVPEFVKASLRRIF